MAKIDLQQFWNLEFEWDICAFYDSWTKGTGVVECETGGCQVTGLPTSSICACPCKGLFILTTYNFLQQWVHTSPRFARSCQYVSAL